MQTPVLTSTAPDQMRLFTAFIKEMRGESIVAARQEATQQGPYMDALATELAADRKATFDKDPETEELTKRGALSGRRHVCVNRGVGASLCTYSSRSPRTRRTTRSSPWTMSAPCIRSTADRRSTRNASARAYPASR